MYGAGVVFGSLVPEPLVRFFNFHGQSTRAAQIIVLHAATVIMAAPWDLSKGSSIALFTVSSILFSFLIRIVYSYGVNLVLDYVKNSKYSNVQLSLLGACYNGGVGIGATCATLVDLSVYPFITLAVINTILAVIVWAIVPLIGPVIHESR